VIGGYQNAVIGPEPDRDRDEDQIARGVRTGRPATFSFELDVVILDRCHASGIPWSCSSDAGRLRTAKV
jgi:hypothetical protein